MPFKNASKLVGLCPKIFTNFCYKQNVEKENHQSFRGR